jgi:hypothetical protein
MSDPWRRLELNDWSRSRRLASIQADPERNDEEGGDESVDVGLRSLFHAIGLVSETQGKAHSITLEHDACSKSTGH